MATSELRIVAFTVLLLIFNVLDTEFTLWGISLHQIEEGNPLLQPFLEQNALYLRAFKIILPVLLGTACWWIRDRSRTLIVYGIGLTLVVYSLILVLHVRWIYAFMVASK